MNENNGDAQTDIDQFRAETDTETVARTLVLPLQESQRKREKVQTAIEDYRELTGYLSDILVSYPVHERNAQNTSIYRRLREEFEDRDVEVGSKVMLAAIHDVVESFRSWRERGRDGELPRFRQNDYFAVTSQELKIVENDGGYGLKANFIPYKPEWFGIQHRPYHESLLSRVVDEEDSASVGKGEIHADEDGLHAHLSITYDVEVFQPEDVETTVGIDLGESTLFAAAVLDGEEVTAVQMEPGAEFRHHRNRIDEKRRRLSEQGDLNGVRACRGDRERYTEQVCHTASKRIVEIASAHAPSKIHLEDLTNYRQTASNPIHDWPFAELQEQIMYKATGAGIPVQKIDPRDTSISCRKCGQATPEFRDGDEFSCRRCGYEVHADVNAAINIAKRGRE